MENEQADLTMWGPLSSLPWEMGSGWLRTDAGAGVGQMRSVDYGVAGRVEIVTGRDNRYHMLPVWSGFKGSGQMTKLVAGAYLFADEPISMRLEYQRLDVRTDLQAVHSSAEKSISLGEHFLMGEAVFNFYH